MGSSQALAQRNVNRYGILIRALIIMLAAGIVNAPAIFVTPLSEFKGWEAETVAGAATLMGTFTVVGHFVGGLLLARIGAKITTAIGGIFIFLAFAGTALVPGSATGLLYVTYGAFFGLGVGFCYTPATYTATSWFPDKRGLATGLCMACNGGSASFLAPICAKLINVTGVQAAMIIVGIVLGIIIVLCSVSGFRQAPDGYAPEGYVPPANASDETQLESWNAARAMKHPAFWHITVCLAVMPILYVVAYPRFTVFMTDAGIDASYATFGVTIYALANVVGRLGLGKLEDKTSYKFTYIWCAVGSIAASLVMMKANSVALFYLAYALLGVGFGATNVVYPVAISKSFGPLYGGSIYGTGMWGYMLFATLLMPRVNTAIVNATGSWNIVFVIAIVLNIVSLISMLTNPKVDRKTIAEAEAAKKQA